MTGCAMTEAQHQAFVIRWSQQQHVRKKWPELDMLHHIPNGGRRDAIEGKHLKEQGVKPGVPDLCLPVPRRGYNGLYIEMKSEKGRVSDAQKWWGEKLLQHGYFWKVCKGWTEAVRVMEWYLGVKDENS